MVNIILLGISIALSLAQVSPAALRKIWGTVVEDKALEQPL